MVATTSVKRLSLTQCVRFTPNPQSKYKMAKDNITKEKAIKKRLEGSSLSQIAEELKIAKSTASLWLKNYPSPKKITNKTMRAREKRKNGEIIKNSEFYKNKRIEYQERGKTEEKQNDPFYIAGCMLYWGEGAKSRSTCSLANCELPMHILFKRFLTKYFDVKDEQFTIKINAYTTVRTQEEIENYWLNNLFLPRECLRKSIWNVVPTSSKQKANILEYGTCHLSVHNVEIVQEIYGAIQKFGEFTKEQWLNKK